MTISIHAPLAGCDQGLQAGMFLTRHFNPRTPCGVRRVVTEAYDANVGISIHAPLAGCDPAQPMHRRLLQVFQSTHPLRGATAQITAYLQSLKDISIHAPLAGCDARCSYIHPQTSISIHAPLAGCDYLMPEFPAEDAIFQSTHPLRGATRPPCRSSRRPAHFNPRTPCGVRLPDARIPRRGRDISIHAPLAGCDPSPAFQSTHPLRGATGLNYTRAGDGLISIHAPLAGCDTIERGLAQYIDAISIHAPLAGCDAAATAPTVTYGQFQSTHPLRGATWIS